MMAKGCFRLSHDLLRDVLCLPDDAVIVAVDYISPMTCAVWVEHNDIPAPVGFQSKVLEPVFKREGEQVTMVEWAEDVPLATLDVMEHNGRHTE
jgi:hypothetical protein